MEILKQLQTAVTEQLPGDSFQSAGTEPLRTTLYACDDCGTTYIASEMESCPECQAVLDEVPSGAELGITSVEP